MKKLPSYIVKIARCFVSFIKGTWHLVSLFQFASLYHYRCNRQRKKTKIGYRRGTEAPDQWLVRITIAHEYITTTTVQRVSRKTTSNSVVKNRWRGETRRDGMRCDRTRPDATHCVLVSHTLCAVAVGIDRVKPKEKEKNKYEHCYIVYKHSIQLTRYVRFE